MIPFPKGIFFLSNFLSNFFVYFLNNLYLYFDLDAMILNTTYTNKDHDKLINNLVGRPYSFLKKLQLRGIGSGRMIIDNFSGLAHALHAKS